MTFINYIINLLMIFKIGCFVTFYILVVLLNNIYFFILQILFYYGFIHNEKN